MATGAPAADADYGPIPSHAWVHHAPPEEPTPALDAALSGPEPSLLLALQLHAPPLPMESKAPVLVRRGLTKHRSSDSQATAAPRGGYQLPARSTLRRDDEALKTQRFDRMMDRFQLRRVTLPRSGSNTSNRTTAAATSSLHDDTLGTTTTPPTIMDLARRLSAVSDKRSTHGYDDDAPLAPMDSTRTSFVPSLQSLLHEPLGPTGWVSQLRLVVLMAVVGAQLIYVPYAIVYATLDPSVTAQWARVALVADGAFFLSLLMVAHTATFTARGQLVTTTRAILRQYRRDGHLALDVLAMLPLEMLWTRGTWPFASCLLAQLALRSFVAHRDWRHFERVRADASTAGEVHTWLDWLLYSRVGHLVRIGRLVLLVVLVAHYMACAWTMLVQSSPVDLGAATRRSPFPSTLAVHIHSIYEVLQLMHGQGLATVTTLQDLFGSFAGLLGAFVLAVIFGHVAVLVANFRANQTAYQRKLESVVAVMDKLQLPHSIRERVHQYYAYLHIEYESLDGEIVKFAKELTHTLELEVVLFKYMDVVMHVPHWRACSPDFQKQLVLNLTVRVYLPDDFVLRRGEVGSACFIISRGVCKQFEYTGGNDETASPPLSTQSPILQRAATRDSTRLSDLRWYTDRAVAPALASVGSMGESRHLPITLARGQTVGEKALITNYLRTSDVRAFTYVEMCVLEREAFQRILTRYPDDRRVVLANIVRQCFAQCALEGVACELMTAVQRVVPLASSTVDASVALVVEAMSPTVRDPTILFGASDNFERELSRLVRQNHATVASSLPPPTICSCSSTPRLERDERGRLQLQLDRIERVLASLVEHHTHSQDRASLRDVKPVGHGSRRARAAKGLAARPLGVSQPNLFHVAAMGGLGRFRPGRRLNRGVSEAVLRESSLTHTPYADKLFGTPPLVAMARSPANEPA